MNPEHGTSNVEDGMVEAASESLLAPLAVGDKLPWKLDSNGEPQWLTVTAVKNDGTYLVRYPNGDLETLTDAD